MSDPELIREILSQILEANGRIERRFATISSPDDFLTNESGIDKLDGICMMLIAIGESLKNLDKITSGSLLSGYPEVDWKGAKGIRILSAIIILILMQMWFSLSAKRGCRPWRKQ